MNIIRVFPRQTRATPTDDLSRVNSYPYLWDDPDEVHVSITFTYDIDKGKRLAEIWDRSFPGKVKIGGPAIGMSGNNFTPGMYLKEGYVITSRGCPNACWFCSVWKREGREIRELPITEGWNVLDDNLLACSEQHIKSVFEMLSKQTHRAEFTGGFEAKLLKDWHIDLLVDLKPKQIFFAYDTPDDYEPLIIAGKKLKDAGFTWSSRTLRAYVLIGYPKDTFDKAEKRLKETIVAGFLPMAMLYRNEKGETQKEWRNFQRQWARPAIIISNLGTIGRCVASL